MRFVFLFLVAFFPMASKACIPVAVWTPNKIELVKKAKHIGLFKIKNITYIPENDGFHGMLLYELETLIDYKGSKIPNVLNVYERTDCYLPNRLKFGIYDMAIYEDDSDKRFYSIEGFSIERSKPVEEIFLLIQENSALSVIDQKNTCREIGGFWKNTPVDTAVSFPSTCEYENSIEQWKSLPDKGNFCKHDRECLGGCIDTLSEIEKHLVLLKSYKEYATSEKSDQWVKPDYCINVEPITYEFNLCGRYDPVSWQQFLKSAKPGTCSAAIIDTPCTNIYSEKVSCS